ncbi:MAG: alpha-2-macroglobulin family protein [Pyrinomonadaceae bacterium]
MNTRKLISGALIYLAVVVAVFSFTYWRLRVLAAGVPQELPAAEERYERNPDIGPPKPFFSLQTNRSYGTNERPRVWVNYRDLDTLDFRIYRINDPAKFFKQLENPHQAGEAEEGVFENYWRKRNPTFLERVRAFKNWFFYRLRRYVRGQLKNDSRRSVNQNLRRGDEQEDLSYRQPLNKSDFAQVPLINEQQLVSTWREKMPPLKDQYDRQQVSLGRQGPGVYVVEAVNHDLRAYGVVMVSDLALVEKTSQRDGGLMVFAVNRQSGAPRAGVAVEVVRGKKTIASGQTDNDGLLRVKVRQEAQAAQGNDGGEAGEESSDGDGEEDETSDRPARDSYLVLATEQRNFAISDLDSFYFSGYDGDNSSGLTSYIYTDRPVYRPNQKVYFKGILRRRNEAGGYTLPAGAVNVSVEDTNGAKLFERELTLSSRGTFSGEADIPEEAALGSYNVSVTATDGGTASAYFEVQEYKKPEYKVSVTTPQKFVPVGQQIQFNVSARYFFGAPVTRADVKYYIYRSRHYPYFFAAEPDPIADFGVDEESDGGEGGYYYGYGNSLVEEGEGKLDREGNLRINFDVPPPGEKDRWDYSYRLEAQVTDAARRTMQASASAVGTRGSVVADATTDRYVYYEGDTAKIKVRTSDYEGRPVSVPVGLKFVEQRYVRIKKNEYGYEYETYDVQERELSAAAMQTNQQGEAFYDYRVAAPGNIAVKLSVNEAGREIVSEGASLWATDRANRWTDYSYADGDETIKLVPDKKSYQPGETAHVLALLPTDKAHLLVTTELQTVLTTRQLTSTGRAVMIDVPIESRFAPNVYLNVTCVKNGTLYANEQVLVVPPRDKLLKVEVVPNKQQYRPREPVAYTILTRNADGSPAAGAEVSVGVVDEAIYSISPDNAGDIRQQFYGRRYNEVSTSFSVNFSFNGYAGKEPLQLAKNKPAYQLADFKNEGEFAEAVVRKLFKDTAHWQADVTTDADGRATVKFDLPDNLTTWRATARAVTSDTRVGWTTSKIVARKDVIIRLATPRFLTAGDTATLSGVVHNYLNTDKTTQISLDVQGAQLLDPPTQTVNIPSNGEHRVNWRVSATQTGELRLLAKALTDTESDAIELPLPVEPRGLKRTTGQAITLSGDGDQERTVTLDLPANADPRARTLRVEASPSIAGTLFGALDYLTSYPYGCTEQTMSSFLPTVIVANALQEVESASIRDSNNIGKKVRKGLDRLYKFQHEDGGWGFWQDDSTDPWMTAYVVDGLTLASRAGYQVDDARIEKGRTRLWGLIDAGRTTEGKQIDIETRAYMTYAHAASGGTEPRFVEDLYNNRGRLQPYGRALLALTLRQRGDRPRAQTVVAEIERTATQNEFDAHWPSRRNALEQYAEENTIEATALSVKALALVAPESEVLAKAARWLVTNRKGGGYYWLSTRQTAFAIYGLTDYLKVSNELSPDYAVEIYLNNEQVLGQQMTATEASSGKTFRLERRREQVGGQTRIRVVKRGPGVLYLSATLDYATNEEQTPAQAGGGLKLSREYLRLRLEETSEGQFKWKTEPLSGDVRSGDLIVSRLTVEGERAQYLMIEDPIPAGCEQIEQVSGVELNYSDRGWTDWYSAREFRDARTVFFLQYFDGKATFQYAMRVQQPGQFRAAPARVEPMYQPTQQANAASASLNILEKQ